MTTGQANWQQSTRWFWFGDGELSGQRDLVVPLGETFTHGPHEMTRYRTQDGAIKSCSVDYFEKHTELAQGMRALR